MQDFAYACPATIEDAVAAMRADGARALAGGTDLIPQMREGRRQVACVVDLKRIPELTSISTRADGGILLGAAASASHVAGHADVVATYPAVAQSARLIGSLQVQNRASLGGNICNAAPSADAVPALICHQASVCIAGPNGSREESLEAFIRGPGRTSLAPSELLSSIILPPVVPRSAAAYLRFTPRRERLLVGCGDSGVNDSGAGMTQALGIRFLDDRGQDLGPGGGEFSRLARIDRSGLDARIPRAPIDAAVSWHNILLGDRGVARTFGPQKGATPAFL